MAQKKLANITFYITDLKNLFLFLHDLFCGAGRENFLFDLNLFFHSSPSSLKMRAKNILN